MRRDRHFNFIPKKPFDRRAIKLQKEVLDDCQELVSIRNRHLLHMRLEDRQRIKLSNAGWQAQRSTIESGANVTTERDLSPRRQKAPSRSIVEGMQIDESDEHCENARRARGESREPDSNATAERERHLEKPVRCSTDEGTENDESDEHSVNAHSSIDEM
jgi:hypothetical protein